MRTSRLQAVRLLSAVPALALGVTLVAGTAITASGAVARTTWTTRLSSPGNQMLNSISCPTTSDCVAVGDGYATTTNGGATWARASDPRLTGFLDTVTCPSAAFCLATGGFATPEESFENAYTSSNLGRTWH